MSSPQMRKRGQRSAFLRRGDVTPTTRLSSNAAGNDIAAGETATSPTVIPPSPLPPIGEASLLLTEEDVTGHNTPAAIAPTLSPQPSQFTQPTQHLSRQRPRFHTVQDLDLALNQAIEGKINTKNAWVSREASDLLEGIAHTIQSTLEAHDQTNDYSGFAKAATVVEGCSKVWTVRVDSTYNQSNQMLQRLLRNDETAGSSGGSPQEGAEPTSPLGLAGDESGTQEGGSSGGSGGAGATRSRGRAALARTLAMEASEINLDERALSSLTQVGIKAEFRAITEKFDQGNAQGLLLNNAPLGAAGNLILDVDYARLAERDKRPTSALLPAAADDVDSRPASLRGSVKPEAAASAWADEEASQQDSHGEPHASSPRHSTSAAEMDGAADIDAVLADLPPYEPIETSLAHEASAAMDETRTRTSGAFAAAAVTSPIDEPPTETRLSNGMALPMAQGELTEARAALSTATGVAMNNDNDGDDGAWYEDDGAMPNDDDDDDEVEVNDAQAETSVAARDDVLDAARALVSGAAELNAMDRGFYTGAQLALEAEDPAAWCPLSATTASAFGAVAPRSELTRLHKEHRLGPQPASSAASSSTLTRKDETSGGVEATVTKRPRKERTVVLELPEDLGSSGAIDLSKAGLAQSALKQSATLTKNVTPLGREILLSAHAAQAVQPFLQGAVQRAKAEHAGLLLPAVPVPGEHIPAYLPYPIDIPCFFQPFATNLSRWNLLRKSVSGALLGRDSRAYLQRQKDTITTTTTTAMAGGADGDTGHRGSFSNNNNNNGGDNERLAANAEDAMGDMPVEFIPGGAEEEEYGDMGADYGADDEDEAGKSAGGFFDAMADGRPSEQHPLLAQFAALHQSHLAATATTTTPRQSTALLHGLTNTNLSVDELINVLRSADVTMPNQVDVVRLRQTMWEVVQSRLGLRHLRVAKEGSEVSDTPSQPPNKAAGTMSDAETLESATLRGPLMKRHVSLVMARARERREAALAASQQHQEEEEEKGQRRNDEDREARTSAVVTGKEDDKTTTLTRKRTRAEVEAESSSSSSSSQTASDTDEEKAEAATSVLKFSDVVRDMLAAVPAISSSGTLSPAFFFFSILFLANEHSVVLASVPALDDLTINGIARGLTQ